MTSRLDRQATGLTGINLIDAPERKGGRRVLSLDVAADDGSTLLDVLAEQPQPEPAAYDDDVRDITELCELSRLEAQLAQYLWDGEHYGTTPSDKLCQLMYPADPFVTRVERNRTKQKIRSVYRSLRVKLLDQWVLEEPGHVKPRLESSNEGDRRLIIGRAMDWGWPSVQLPLDLTVTKRPCQEA